MHLGGGAFLTRSVPIMPCAAASCRNLGMCCWSGDPTLRPSASVLVKLLRQQLESLKQSGQTTGGAAPSTARA